MPTATKRAAAPQVPYKLPVIRTLGADDYADGTGFVKVMVISAPDIGKTRWASAWPRPVFLQCEPLVSITKRQIEYAGEVTTPRAIQIASSADALNATKYLKEQGTRRTSGSLPNYQTIVFDTLDAFSRLVKDEWMDQNNAGAFEGHAAWGYLEAKMNAVLTRLMNTPANVIILCHWKDREITPPDGGDKVTVYEPNLQGAVKDTVIQDFSLIGWMDYYWTGSGDERERHRGITFEPTPQRPFLKNHYGIRPEGQDVRIAGTKLWWPVEINDGTNGEGDNETFVATNYVAIFNAMLNGMEGIGESKEIEQIPDASIPPADAGMPADAAGGPVDGAATAAAKATAPPAKKVAAKKAAAPPAAKAQPAPSAPEPSAPEPPVVESATPEPEAAAATDVAEGVSGSDEVPAADEPEQATDGVEPPEATHDEAVAAVAAATGSEVVSDSAAADAPSEDAGNCAICNKSMEEESEDLVQLSRLKHKKLVLPNGVNLWDTPGVCYEDYQKLNEQKANNTGLYDPAENPAMAS